MSDTIIITDAPPRRCRQCQATCADGAKFCWMCGTPLEAQLQADCDDLVQSDLVKLVDDGQRDDHWSLWLAPLLAIPVVAIVIYGLARTETFYAWIFGPALIIGTLVAVGHQLLSKVTIRPRSNLQRASVAGSSLLMGMMAGVVTVTVTVVVAVVLFLLFVASVIIAIMEFCGISPAEM